MNKDLQAAAARALDPGAKQHVGLPDLVTQFGLELFVGLTANCLHPGFVASRFGDDNGGLFRIGIGIAKRLLAISLEDGAATSIYLASAPEVEGRTGLYFDKCKPATPSAAAQDDTVAQELWLRSARIAGIAA